MADLVPAEQIESIVGAHRHPHQHLGRAVSAEQTVYILHSQKCKDSGIDLRECEWSRVLDQGIDLDDWKGYEDRAVVLAVVRRRLFPVVPEWLAASLIRGAEVGAKPCDCDMWDGKHRWHCATLFRGDKSGDKS